MGNDRGVVGNKTIGQDTEWNDDDFDKNAKFSDMVQKSIWKNTEKYVKSQHLRQSINIRIKCSA